MILIPLYHRSPRTNAQHRQLGDASNESRSCGSAFGRGTIVKWYVTWYRPYSHMYICCLFRRLPTSWRWTAPWLPWTRLQKILVSAQFAAFGLSGDEKRCWWPGPSTSRNGSGGHMPMPSKFKKWIDWQESLMGPGAAAEVNVPALEAVDLTSYDQICIVICCTVLWLNSERQLGPKCCPMSTIRTSCENWSMYLSLSTQYSCMSYGNHKWTACARRPLKGLNVESRLTRPAAGITMTADFIWWNCTHCNCD